MKLQEENSYIQREMNSMSSKDGQWKGKIKELEFEIDSYYTRAVQAESLALVKHHLWMLRSKEENSKMCLYLLPLRHCACPNPKIAPLQSPLAI